MDISDTGKDTDPHLERPRGKIAEICCDKKFGELEFKKINFSFKLKIIVFPN